MICNFLANTSMRNVGYSLTTLNSRYKYLIEKLASVTEKDYASSIDKLGGEFFDETVKADIDDDYPDIFGRLFLNLLKEKKFRDKLSLQLLLIFLSKEDLKTKIILAFKTCFQDNFQDRDVITRQRI